MIEPETTATPPDPAPVGRDQLLARSGKLREATVVVDDLGPVLVRELSGDERAMVIETQAEAAQRGKPDIKAYQRSLLLCGLVDPDSPEGARRPLLEKGDLDAAMKLGANTIDALTTRIEELSGLAVDAEAIARAGFPVTQSDGSTSDSPSG